MGALITVVAKSNKNRSVDLSLPGDMRTGMTEQTQKPPRVRQAAEAFLIAQAATIL
ncbi:hypothetical protein [Sinorhizobium meliloti]|uniref:hypothetical protein n=1 Tax=Rhizobium meliloti TaxID=382 RepID=UPI0013E36345|nr:hypothetical protein [Sinorhizobium meliloti]